MYVYVFKTEAELQELDQWCQKNKIAIEHTHIEIGYFDKSFDGEPIPAQAGICGDKVKVWYSLGNTVNELDILVESLDEFKAIIQKSPLLVYEVLEPHSTFTDSFLRGYNQAKKDRANSNNIKASDVDEDPIRAYNNAMKLVKEQEYAEIEKWSNKHAKDFYNTTTAGTKDTTGKPKFDRLAFEALGEMNKVHEFGDNKYDRANWKKGLKFSDLASAAIRHLSALMEKGETLDKESNLLHSAHAAVNCEMLTYYLLHLEKYHAFNDSPQTENVYLTENTK